MFLIYKTEKELKELDNLNKKYTIHREVSHPKMYCSGVCDYNCKNCEVFEFNEKNKEVKLYEISYPYMLT